MDTFRHAVETGKISSVATLRRMYRRLSKSVHPDMTDGTDEAASHERFVRLKADYDIALRLIEESGKLLQSRTNANACGHSHSAAHESSEKTYPSFFACTALFCDLIAGNFPLGGDIRQTNKLYLDRVRKFDVEVSKFGEEFSGLVLYVERELYAIRGNAMVSSHAFNLVRLYLNNLSDYLLMGHLFSRMYLKKQRESAIECLKAQNANSCVMFIDWLLRESHALED